MLKKIAIFSKKDISFLIIKCCEYFLWVIKEKKNSYVIYLEHITRFKNKQCILKCVVYQGLFMKFMEFLEKRK